MHTPSSTPSSAAPTLILAILLAAASLCAPAQAADPPRVDMLFPGGVSKALILSYDDGPVSDRRMVKLMNQYGLRGTFHLNSNKLGSKDYLDKDEIRTLFQGHEVSVHTANHPALNALSRSAVMREVSEDRRELERLTGKPVRGMAYPFGNHNHAVVEAVGDAGIEYARTVIDTNSFDLPVDFLTWHPTIHQFGKTNYTPDQPERDQVELAAFFKLVDDFLKTDNPAALLEVWGHSWENNGVPARWDYTEQFFRKVSNRPDVLSITHIELMDYIVAFRNLKFSVTGDMVVNPSALDVYVRANGKTVRIAGGSTTALP
jgi:peptidoglycan-N-acetylglucosamine deacetylase